MKYFDNAATTYPKPESVYKKMDEVNRNLAVNTGRASYRAAREAANIIDRVREKMLSMVKGIGFYDVILTPSATVALNEILFGMEWSSEDVVYVSPFEHNAVMRPLHMLHKKYGFKVIELPFCEATKGIDLEKTEYAFLSNVPTKLFMVHISNVTGYILPVAELTKMAEVYNCEILLDASQSLGLLEMDFRNMNIDYVAFAGHKNLYGPFGAGGFFIKKGRRLKPYLAGGTGSDSLNMNMPKEGYGRYEPASPNVVAIAGLEAALDEAMGKEENFFEKERKLTEKLVNGLEKIREVVAYVPDRDSHVGIVAFNIKGYKASEAGMILDEDFDIAVRTGYHCAPLIHKYLGDEGYSGAVRASVGRFTTEQDVERFLAAVKEIAEE